MSRRGEFREGGLLWEGRCDIALEKGLAVGEGLIRIYAAGLELRDASAASYISRFLDGEGEAMYDGEDDGTTLLTRNPTCTTVQFKTMFVRADTQDGSDVIMIESPETGKIEFRRIERASLVRQLMQLLVSLQLGTATEDQKLLWESRVHTSQGMLALLDNRSAYRALREKVSRSSINPTRVRDFLADEKKFGGGVLIPPCTVVYHPPQLLKDLPAPTAVPLQRRQKRVPLASVKLADAGKLNAQACITPSFVCIESNEIMASECLVLFPLKDVLSFAVNPACVVTVKLRGEGGDGGGEGGDIDDNALAIQFEFGGKSLRAAQAFHDTLKESWLLSSYAAAFGDKKVERKALLNLLNRFYLHFESLDAAKEGFVRRSRFEQAMRPLLQSRDFGNYIFRGLSLGSDATASAAITFHTFLKGLGASVFGGVEDKLKFSFKLFDLNEDGTLDEHEFVEALRLFHSINPFFLEQGDTDSVEDLATRLFRVETGRTSSQVLLMDDAPPEATKLTFDQYKSCILSSTRDFGDVQVGSTLGGESVTKHSDGSQGSAPGSSRFIFFGNEDFELASRILQGITTSVLSTDGGAPQISELRRSVWGAAQAALEKGKTPGQFAPVLQTLQEQSAVVRQFDLSAKRGSPGTPAEEGLYPEGRKPFYFTDYAPALFRLIRLQFGIGRTEYLKSLGIDHMVFNLLFGSLCTLKQMSSTGSSGSIFFVSHDERFIVKSLPRREFDVLLRILPDYVMHVHRYPDTLVGQYCGLYSMQVNGEDLLAVAMLNTFTDGSKIKQVYDLKGSTVRRSVGKKGRERGGLSAMKDLDLNRAIELRWDMRQRLLYQLRTDTAFLEKHGVIDYSLLVGLRSPRIAAVDIPPERALVTKALKSLKITDKISKKWCVPLCCTHQSSNSHQHTEHDEATYATEVELVGPSHQTASSAAGSQRPQGKPVYRLSVFRQHEGGILTRDGSEVVQFGLIDILTYYDTTKAMEHRLKRIMDARLRMSCVPPSQYRNRLLNFMEHVFTDCSPTISLLRLPSYIAPPGGRFRAVSEAGVLVELVLGASPPTFWVVTTVSSLQGAGNAGAGETGIVRTKVPLECVLFSSPASASVYSVGVGGVQDERGEEEVSAATAIAASCAQYSCPLVVTTRENVLYPTRSVYLTDLETKYRVMSMAAAMLPTAGDTRAPASPQHDSLATTSPLIQPLGRAETPGPLPEAVLTFGFGHFTSPTRFSREAATPLAAFTSSVLNSAESNKYIIVCGVYEGEESLRSVAPGVQRSAAAPGEEDGYHYAVQHVKAKLGHVYYMEALVGSDTGFLAVFVSYKHKGELAVTKKACYGGVHCIMGDHYLSPFVAIVSGDPAIHTDRDVFQDTVRFVSSSLDIGSSVLEVVPLVLWVCPKDPQMDPFDQEATLPRVSTKPVLLSGRAAAEEMEPAAQPSAQHFVRFKSVGQNTSSQQMYFLCRSECRASPDTPLRQQGLAFVLDDAEVGETQSKGSSGEETAAQSDHSLDSTERSAGPLRSVLSAAAATLALCGPSYFCVGLSMRVPTLDSFRGAPATGQLSLSQSLGNFKSFALTNPRISFASLPQRPSMVADELCLSFKSVMLRRGPGATCGPDLVAAKQVLLIGNEFVQGNSVEVPPRHVDTKEGVVTWGDFQVKLGDVTPGALPRTGGSAQQFAEFLLSRRLVVTLCSRADRNKPHGNWVYRSLQGSLKPAFEPFGITLHDAGAASEWIITGKIAR